MVTITGIVVTVTGIVVTFTGIVVTVTGIMVTVTGIAKPAIVLNSRWTPAAVFAKSCY